MCLGEDAEKLDWRAREKCQSNGFPVPSCPSSAVSDFLLPEPVVERDGDRPGSRLPSVLCPAPSSPWPALPEGERLLGFQLLVEAEGDGIWPFILA